MSNLVRRDATSTSGGELTSGTQTIAGVKTFSSGIGGNISGTAPAAGCIGEKITWASAPSSQAITSAADWTNAAITLTAGTWLVQANIFTDIVLGTGGGYTSLSVAIVDSGNNTVQNMAKQANLSGNVAAVAGAYQALPFLFAVSVSANTTYHIRASLSAAGTGPVGTLRNQSGAYSEFFGIRIA